MANYVIKGSIKNPKGNPITNVKVQAMDSDQEFSADLPTISGKYLKESNRAYE